MVATYDGGMGDREPRRGRKGEPVVRITTAAESRAADIAARQRRYVWSMAVRTLCFVGAVAVGPGWLRWTLVVAAICLPYVAVVMANAADHREDHFQPVEPRFDLGELPPAAPRPDPP